MISPDAIHALAVIARDVTTLAIAWLGFGIMWAWER